ncbi:protein Wnt-3a [Exaiptasia diaphana]|uniref:Protein Wnt n=1 Tax=Exaiptasia diaphana TaxID=2652724 RepID=A0A913WS10_EXADI|nr:protein Wnt-3a [Exaiptasia diaphana]KXJ28076.1 Protein Wnt-3a [Exaiptasia diaphana]
MFQVIKMKHNLLIMLTISSNLFTDVEGVWWTLGTQVSASSDPVKKGMLCYVTPELNGRQREVCRQHPSLMGNVALGAKYAIDECQHQFRSRRWNCSTISDSGSLFTSALDRGCREAAFVHAITAAGVAHAVTDACSSGNIESCDCDRSKSGSSGKGWTWSGCSSNIKFGEWFSKQFTEARERGNSLRMMMNRHNSRAGRKAIGKLVWRKCKCHGLSGSCSMKTCWIQQPNFRQVGEHLRDRYNGASEMIININRKGKQRLKPKHKHLKKPTESDLIYYQSSPNFCDHNPKAGSLGTSGRKCNYSSTGLDGCELLCCGRGHNIQQAIVTRNCNCVFLWCCEVKCERCKELVNVYTCK